MPAPSSEPSRLPILGIFDARSMPPGTRPFYVRELAAWPLLAVAFAAGDGTLAGVVARTSFEGTVPERTLNFVVGLLTSAIAIGNLTSFAWTRLANGRRKVAFLVRLQLAAAAAIAAIALVPRTAAGLWVLAGLVVVVGACWSGVVTLRSTVWRANYPRGSIARLTGRIGILHAFAQSASGGLVGALVERGGALGRLVFVVAASVGVAGAMRYRRLRVRHRRRTEAAERAARPPWTAALPLRALGILREDRAYRRFQIVMSLFAVGNVMTIAPMIIVLRTEFGVGAFGGALLMTALPVLVMPFTIPLWSRLYDRSGHVLEFRRVHAWAFVAANVFMLVGAVGGLLWAMAVGAIGRGVAFGGAVLAWNLGHHDYAPPERTSEYMSVHVTLEGVRSLIAPMLGVGLYELLESGDRGLGGWVFLATLLVNASGAVGFAVLARRRISGSH